MRNTVPPAAELLRSPIADDEVGLPIRPETVGATPSSSPDRAIKPAATAPSRRGILERLSHSKLSAVLGVLALAASTYATTAANTDDGGGDTHYGHTISFKPALHCFSHEQKQYTSAWPADTPQNIRATKAAVHCMVIALFGNDQWPPARALYKQESGFMPGATNPQSGACGVPQSDPCAKMLNDTGGNHSVEATMKWSAEDVAVRYGNYANAWTHEQQKGWY